MFRLDFSHTHSLQGLTGLSGYRSNGRPRTGSGGRTLTSWLTQALTFDDCGLLTTKAGVGVGCGGGWVVGVVKSVSNVCRCSVIVVVWPCVSVDKY